MDAQRLSKEWKNCTTWTPWDQKNQLDLPGFSAQPKLTGFTSAMFVCLSVCLDPCLSVCLTMHVWLSVLFLLLLFCLLVGSIFVHFCCLFWVAASSFSFQEFLHAYNYCYSYIPVLMAQAKIYWDLGNYQQVEKIFRKSVEFSSEHDSWKLNVAHVLFMQVYNYIWTSTCTCTRLCYKITMDCDSSRRPNSRRLLVFMNLSWRKIMTM